MAAITVVFYRDPDDCPALEWLDSLPEEAYAKGIVRIERLAGLGHELRRPEADYLRDGIYELRWRLGHVNFRLLYFFYGRQAVVLAHGLTKEDKVPCKDIALAARRKARYTADPERHTYREGLT
ncbi:MAG: type II toxin-antitoxin system RelE/ParE family toxin [Elusimicrobia bacterium]|nr:type II toxin-antitoxin system RelE/ParE family toxin [Elusimicrobiota bacterium]